MTKIILIRHAEAEGNIYRRAHGHYNGLITEKGFKQIEKVKKRYEHEKITAVYSSDLLRTMTTATSISEPHNLQINPTKMLREVALGEWEDMAWGDISYKFPEMIDKFNNDPAEWSIKDSESYESVKTRMFKFITETAKKHNGETIAMFSHGFAIRSLHCLLEGVQSNETDKVMYWDNTAVGILTYDKGKLSLTHHSDNTHLADEFSTLARQSWWRAEKKHISENLRYMPLNEVCSDALLKIFKAKAGERAHVNMQYAAFLGDEPIGIVGIDTKRESRQNNGWISYIHVVPNHRKKTFATQLLGLAVSDFRRLRRENIRIEIPSGSLGINFMSKCGFKVLDVTDRVCLMEKNIKNW